MGANDNADWGRIISECLDSTTVAVLATGNGSRVWATPVYFSYDDSFNIYFISPADTAHMRNIRARSSVALAVVMPREHSGLHQVCLQVTGIASEVPDEDIERVYEMKNRRLAPEGSSMRVENEGHFVKDHGGMFIRISPTAMHYLDTRNFGGSPRVVPLGALLQGTGRA
jgi:nitroimidazol reductase NimA-like FMN-containing flavoprotein (pyridoxamine 5'-phosphate oxidase superfamily)